MATNWLRVSQLVIDLSVLSVSFAAAFFIRFDGAPPLDMTARLALTGPYVVALEIGLLYAYGVRRFVWRYVGLREVLCILQATLVTTFVLLIARFVFGQLQDDYAFLRHGVIPYGVLAANSVLAFLRHGQGDDAPLLVVLNLTPLRHASYGIGVPEDGCWRELLNTDAAVYGGSGAGNLGGVHAEAQPAHGQPFRVRLERSGRNPPGALNVIGHLVELRQRLAGIWEVRSFR